ncbi:MAG: hypothetical protein R6X08_06875 [Desulfosalsimonadaceae bacterium]
MNKVRQKIFAGLPFCIWVAAVFACLLTSAVCRASCRIELNNGAAFVAARCRAENGLIQFSYCNGRISIPRQIVAAIKNSRRLPPAETIKSLPPPPCFNIEKQPPGNMPGKLADTARQYKKALTSNRKKIREQRKIFRRAKSRNQKQARQEAWKRLGDLKKARRRLRRRVLQLYDGTLPDWWQQ